MADPANVELLCLDVDGVLTDGGIVLDDNGVETKRFHVRDGSGIWLWSSLGYRVALITGRSGRAVAHRARELNVGHVIQGSTDKAADLRALLDELGLEAARAAVLADDLPDLPMMRVAGYPMAVADAVQEVHDAAAYVTTRPGGHGAVREAIEHLVKAKGRWADVMERFGG